MTELVQAALFLLLGFALFWGWFNFVRGVSLHRRPLIEALLFAGVLGFGQLLIWSQILGFLALLHFALLLGANGMTTLVVIAIGQRRRIAAAALPRATRDDLESGPRGSRALWAMRALAVIATGALVWLAGIVPPLRYDELAYHMPIIAAMRQDHSLLFAPMNRPTIDGYPKHIEIWFFHIFETFGIDRWVDLGQLPFAVLGVLAVCALARRLGVSKHSAALASLLYPFSPVVLSQLRTAYIDVAVSSMIVASSALAVISAEDEDRVSWATLGVALGITMGSKGSGPAYAALIGVAFVVLRRLRLKSWAVTLRQSAAVGLLAFSIGASNFVKNYLVYDNPLYPMRVTVGQTVLFEGPRTVDTLYGQIDDGFFANSFRVLVSWVQVTEWRHSALLGGFGLTWWLLLPCLIACVVRAARARDVTRLIVYLVLPAALFAATPVAYRVRFVLFLLGFGSVALADVLDRSVGGARRALSTTVPMVAGLAVLHAYAMPVVNHLRSALKGSPDDDVLLNRCVPESQRSAFRALRRLASAGTRVFVIEDGVPEQFFAYCFWNDHLSNWVAFVGPEEGCKPRETSPFTGPTYWYVPKAARSRACVEEASRTFQPVYSDETVLIVEQVVESVSRGTTPGI